MEEQQQQVEQEALDRYNKSQQDIQEKTSGTSDELPEGFNADGTPIVDEPTNEPILGKFKSQEDLVKAYQELEKKLGADKNEPTKEPDTKTEETTVTNDEGVKVDVSKFNSEFLENGSLSEDSYKQLDKLGFSRGDVDRYIAGQQALMDTYKNKVYAVAGGEEQYVQLVDWAAANLDASVITDYNEAVGTGNLARTTQLLEYMQLKAGTTVPNKVNRITPTATNEGGGLKAFTDKGEWQKATANSLYGKDVKYTNMIDKRYLASKREGTI